MRFKSLKMAFVARIIRHELCMIYMHFLFFCSKIIFDKRLFSYCWVKFAYPGPLYTFLVCVQILYKSFQNIALHVVMFKTILLVIFGIITGLKICMIYMHFLLLFFVQKSFLTKDCFLTVEINLPTRVHCILFFFVFKRCISPFKISLHTFLLVIFGIITGLKICQFSNTCMIWMGWGNNFKFLINYFNPC